MALRLNISHDHPDVVLEETLDRIDDEFRVADALGNNSVETVLTSANGAVTVDLIAHAADGVLQLGLWQVGGGAAAIALANAVQAHAGLSLTELRVLGCNTAVTEAGKTAIRDLAMTFGVRVWGTVVPIGALDFDKGGFTSSTLIIHDGQLDAMSAVDREARIVGRLRKAQIPRPPSIAEVLHDLQVETGESIASRRRASQVPWRIAVTDASQLAGVLGSAPALARLPGLLATPDRELVVPAGAAHRFHRVSSLLDGRLLRVYPSEQLALSVVLDPAQRAVLDDVFEASADAQL